MKANSTNMSIMRIQKEYEKLQKSPISNIIAKPNPNNFFNWHFVIYGLKDCPYENGVYHGLLILPAEYPHKPPSIQFITQNGRFKVGEKICMSFSNYHPESWNIAWNIEKMLLATVSFMNSEEATTGGMRCGKSERKRLAKLSLLQNLKNQDFVTIFYSNFKEMQIDEKLLQPQAYQQYEQKLYDEIGLSNTNQSKMVFFVTFIIFLALILYNIIGLLK